MTDAPTDLLMEAVEHGLANDTGAVLRILDRIVDDHGVAMLGGVVAGLGEMAAYALAQVQPLGPGDMWAIQSLVPDIDNADQADLFAARYVVATANGAKDIASALLRAEFVNAEPERIHKIVLGTFGLALSLLRLVPPGGTT